MGIDLTLLPFECSYAHVVLPVDRDRELFVRISRIPTKRIGSISSYLAYDEDGERCYGELDTDPYGNPLRWVQACCLKKCKIPGPVGAYLEELNDEHRVVLFWH